MTDPNELLRPQYNSTLKLVKQIEDVKLKECNLKISEEDIEKIHEKVATKKSEIKNLNLFFFIKNTGVFKIKSKSAHISRSNCRRTK